MKRFIQYKVCFTGGRNIWGEGYIFMNWKSVKPLVSNDIIDEYENVKLDNDGNIIFLMEKGKVKVDKG